jgi:hypothetical protein
MNIYGIHRIIEMNMLVLHNQRNLCMKIFPMFRSPDSRRDHDDDRRGGSRRERRRSPSKSR